MITTKVNKGDTIFYKNDEWLITGIFLDSVDTVEMVKTSRIVNVQKCNIRPELSTIYRPKL